tara:strand:- start:28 stop:714 length:687 start_codon:yes stop_codon:yes gene_type:complete
LFKGNKILGLIPARSGSKRLPNKNILDMHGKPMIAWSISSAIKSKYIDDVVVSSDSDRILNISNQYGAKPLKRPLKYSKDNSKSEDVILNSIKRLKTTYDYIVLLQPTSPLRTSLDIDNAIKLLFQKKAKSVISVNILNQDSMLRRKNYRNKSLVKLGEVTKKKPSLYYFINGAIYFFCNKFFQKSKKLYCSKHTYGFLMEKHKSIDIDDYYDFITAKTLMKVSFKKL